MQSDWTLNVALGFNLVVLIPVIGSLLTEAAGSAFGPATPARGILTAVYIAIASAVLLVAGIQGAAWTVVAALTLFAVQITYKSATVALVDLGNPVVITNSVVIAVHLTCIAAWWRALPSGTPGAG